jgi:hypothetical protein
MSQLRVRVCLFSPLGEALVFGPADPPEKNGNASCPDPAPPREAAPADGVRAPMGPASPGRGAVLKRILRF